MLRLKGLGLQMGMDYTVMWNEMNPDFERIDCYPEENSNEAKCRARGCIWQVRLCVCVNICVHTWRQEKKKSTYLRTLDIKMLATAHFEEGVNMIR